MREGVGSSGTVLQESLSEFLYAESLHTLGIYRYACERLQGVKETLEQREGKDPTTGKKRKLTPGEVSLKKTVEDSLYCNEQLRDHLHRAVPLDADEPAAKRRPSPFRLGDGPARPNRELLKAIKHFYGDAAVALTQHLHNPELAKGQDAAPMHRLGANYAFIHDPQRRGELSDAQRQALAEGRIRRIMARYANVHKLLGGADMPDRAPPVLRPGAERDGRFAELLDGCAGGTHGRQLLAILEAMNEAHMWMHQAEHVRAQSFGRMFVGIPETNAETRDMLRYSLALNTFVFVAARTTPWIFAEDVDEREYVISNYEACCKSLAPTYCMWIATQFGLLALHRRAFTYWTLGEHDSAYRDFHKLTRLLRGLRAPAGRRGLRVPGTNTFIEGLGGMSEHHIGRIYRGQHAHRMALRYFKRASRRLKGWEEDDEIGHLVKNSHWRINLFINEGKANYELGRVKHSILHYAQAWRAFLLLVDSETHATANLAVVEKFTKWLEQIVDDPELNRRELRAQLEPLVSQFGTLRTPPHLRLLAADIVMRMGHLLFILKLPPARWDPSDVDQSRPPVSDHELAERCIAKAAFLDPTSTLTAADLLKIDHEAPRQVRSAEPIEVMELKRQWPSGSGRFEEAARITEYTLQRWLADTTPKADEHEPVGREKVARELLGAFLAHTDSSNVKLAQVYRYLMQKPTSDKRDAGGSEYALDLLCLRRYSSFFPFLPRPSAFRAPGGGYFVRANEPGHKPFGIAIDPGPDFIENLYRSGFGLADVHMIVLTHDHADHIASLDPMLALMGIRKGLGDPTFETEDKEKKIEGTRLAIVGNESVYQRYAFYNQKEHPILEKDGKPAERRDAVRVLTFTEVGCVTSRRGKARVDAVKDKCILLPLDTLQIEPVRTWGHPDANGFASQGFVLSVGEGEGRSSILFTGDTGAPSNLAKGRGRGRPEEEHLLAEGSKSLRTAVQEADVVVAHLSSVPLRELRKLAGLGSGGEEALAEYAELWEAAVERAGAEARQSSPPDWREGVDETKFLLGQIQFGFRSKPKEAEWGLRVSPLSDIEQIKKEPDRHLYLTGLLDIADLMAKSASDRAPLLLIGELREELGTFRTRIASRVSAAIFGSGPLADGKAKRQGKSVPVALTTDIGLRVHVCGPVAGERPISVLCTTCDLDNDLIPVERFHGREEIREVCVKGEDEGVFYSCPLHSPSEHDDYLWLESIERYDVFGD